MTRAKKISRRGWKKQLITWKPGTGAQQKKDFWSLLNVSSATVGLFQSYLVANKRKIPRVHRHLKQRASNGMEFIQLSKTWQQLLLRLFWVGCKINTKIVLSKPLQDSRHVLKITTSFCHTLRAGRFSNGMPPLDLRKDENGWVYNRDCNRMVRDSSRCMKYKV